MKKLILVTAIILGALFSEAQETFFPTKEGTVLIYKSFDKKDKETSMVKYTIKQVNVAGENMDITYLCESLDPKEKLVFKEEITVHKKGDILYFDMSNYLNKAAFQQDGEIPAEVQITGNNLQIPSNPKPGDLLPDANVEMALKMGFVNMKMSANLTNRKVETIENIAVKAGSFECYKFSGDILAVAMGIKANMKSVEWYSKGIGTIKSESYDKNDKLQSYTELVEIR